MESVNKNSLLEKRLGLTARPHARFPLPKQPKRPNVQEDSGLREITSDSTPASSVDPKEKEWANLVATLNLHRRRLLRLPGVTAVDIGYKIKEKENNRFLDQLALRVHVERKLHEEEFKDRLHDLINPDYYPGPDGPVLMDVIEADYKPTQLVQTVREVPQEKVNRRRRIDPLVGGISIGSPEVPVGTLGALVWDQLDGSVCILSNWHVLAGDLHAEVGTPCFQPGRFDQGRSTDVVARLKRWSFNRQTDAALAELTGNRHYCAGEIVSMFQTIADVTEPYLGMEVLKSGRSTGFTPGFIDGLFFSAAIEYSNGLVRVFEEQIHIAPLPPEDPSKPIPRISEPGDSGSVWVTKAPGEGYLAVGLHFAGDLPNSAFGEYALANPMTVVVDRLEFSFRPLFLEIRGEDVIQAGSPIASQPMQNQRRNGAQPVRIVVDGLAGSGSQPEDDRMGSGG